MTANPILWRMARPSKFNERVSEKIIELARQGKTDQQIADIIGVHVRTIENWKGKHQNLLWALNEAKAMADDLVEASLFQRAVGYSHPDQKWFSHEGTSWFEPTIKHYPPDPTAAIFWLKNRRPDEWREKVEMNVEGSISLTAAMDAAYRRAQKALTPNQVVDVEPIEAPAHPVHDESGEKLTLPIRPEE